MIELNKVLLAGRLTRDPELRYLASGMAVSDLRVASGRSYYDKGSGERKEETVFVDVTVWGKTAEFCDKYFSRGKAIFIEGRLKYDEWNDKESGKKRSKVTITADRVQFAEPKSAEGGGQGYEGGGGGGDRQSRSEPEDPPAGQPSGGGGGAGAGGGTNDDLPF